MLVAAKAKDRINELRLQGWQVELHKVEAHTNARTALARGNAKADYLATVGSTGYGIPPTARTTIPLRI